MDLIKLNQSLLEKVDDDSISNLDIFDNIFNPKSLDNLENPLGGHNDGSVARVDIFVSIHPKNPFINYFNENFLYLLETLSRNRIIFKEAAFVDDQEIFEKIINIFTIQNNPKSKSHQDDIDLTLSETIDENVKEPVSQIDQEINQILIFKLSSIHKFISDLRLTFTDNQDFHDLIDLTDGLVSQKIGVAPNEIIADWFAKITSQKFLAMIPIKNEIFFISKQSQLFSRMESGSIHIPSSSKSDECLRYSLALSPLAVRQVAIINNKNNHPCLLQLPSKNNYLSKHLDMIKFHLLVQPYGPVSAFIGDSFELNYLGLNFIFNDKIKNYSFYDSIVVLGSQNVIDKISEQPRFVANDMGPSLSQILQNLMENSYQ